MDISYFVYPFISWWAFRLKPEGGHDWSNSSSKRRRLSKLSCGPYVITSCQPIHAFHWRICIVKLKHLSLQTALSPPVWGGDACPRRQGQWVGAGAGVVIKGSIAWDFPQVWNSVVPTLRGFPQDPIWGQALTSRAWFYCQNIWT